MGTTADYNTDQRDFPFVFNGGGIKERLVVIDLINQLDIADRLKELLINSGITFKLLLNMSASDFAKMLGIDEYIARLVSDAISKSHKNVSR